MQAKLSYDPLKDFVAVGLANLAPHAIVLHESVPAKTVPELVALSKKQQITLATSGAGSAGAHDAGALHRGDRRQHRRMCRIAAAARWCPTCWPAPSPAR